MRFPRSCRWLVLGAGRLALALVLLAGCTILPARGQPPAKPARIGVLTPGSPGPSLYVDAFREGLREQGYLEGQNLRVEYRYAEGRLERFPALAAELVALPVDAILVMGGAPEVAAVKELTATIPIVFVAAGDPVRSGLVASLARPGGNVTGLSTVAVELGGKRLELLKETAPQMTRVAVLWNAANATKAQEFAEAQAAAPTLGLQVLSLEVRAPDELEPAFQAATRDGAEGLSVLNDPLVFTNRARIANLAAESRLPAIYENRDFVQPGGLMAYGPSFTAAVRRAAYYVTRVLQEARPGDLPVEQPTTFDLVLNARTAQALGITFPPEVLLSATEVIR